MNTPTPKRKIFRGKENLPPWMESSTTSTHRTRRFAAVSRVASSYRTNVQNNVIGGSGRHATPRRNQVPEELPARFDAAPEPIPPPTETILSSTVPILPIVAVLGWRESRAEPLVHEDLWKDGVGPVEQIPKAAHQKCGICHMVKSHPVSYLCGHSHCYVCIRLWLERRWTCPECIQPMYRAPFRHYGEEASLAADYPDSKDNSVVSYSWSGLVFPKEPEVLVPESP